MSVVKARLAAACSIHHLLTEALFFSHDRLPGVFLFYEVSPLHVEITETYRKGWVAFFTSVCAVIGGVVSVMGMVRVVFGILGGCVCRV